MMNWLTAGSAGNDPGTAPHTSLRAAIGRCVPLLQAAFFALGGIWAVLGRRSFETVSGPKVDYWLVRTVGGLLTVVGAVIGSASARGRVTREIRWLALGTSGVLTIIDLVYVAKRRIRPVYLLDAAANTMAIAGWHFLERGATSQDAERLDPGEQRQA